MKKETKISMEEWVKEAFKDYPSKPEGWFTVNDIVKLTGANARTIRGRIRQMLDNNELDVMDILENGKHGKCYRKKN